MKPRYFNLENKIRILSIFFLLLCSCSEGRLNQHKPAFIAWGQSNLGTGPTGINTLDSALKHPYPNVLFYQHSKSYDPYFIAMDPADNTSYQSPDQNQTFSLQFDLYPKIAEALHSPVYVIHHGKGNTGLEDHWRVGEVLYEELVYKTESTLDALSDTAGRPDIKFMLIVHGEYDSRIEAMANKYEANLRDFISSFRERTELDSLPVVIVLLNPNGYHAPKNPLRFVDKIRRAQINLADDPNIHLVESVGAKLASDSIHYTRKGQAVLSQRIFDCLLFNGILMGKPI